MRWFLRFFREMSPMEWIILLFCMLTLVFVLLGLFHVPWAVSFWSHLFDAIYHIMERK